MRINPHIFRGYDLRGEVDKDLNPEIVEHLGKAYGTYLTRHNIPTAIIGHDSRGTSPEYAKALTKGLVWAGINVTFIGLTLSGTFYWSQYHLKSKGGAIVTASHNPPNYNGFKFAVDYSETMVSDQMQELCRMAQEDDIQRGDRDGKVIEQDITEAFFNDVVSRFNDFKNMKIVVDAACSTPGFFIPRLLKKIGCEVVEKNCNLDPTFPMGTPDPTAKEFAERLSKEVLEAKADLGFSYDCDGDRIGIVDSTGRIIWNDVLVALFAKDVLLEHPGAKIMYNTLCSKVVDDAIKESKGIPFMWRTGHSFLKKKNQEVKAAFIGELSGHFFFSADYYNHDDGSYSTLRLISYLTRTNQTLSQAVENLPKYISSPEIKVGCPDDKKVAFMDKISQVLKKDYPQAEVIDDERAGDGVRLEMEDRMLVIRYSQNGPYLTIKFEAKTQTKYDELKKYISQLLHNYSEVDWSFGVNVEALS